MNTSYYSLRALASALALPRAYLRRLAEAGRLPRLLLSPGRYRYNLEAVRKALRELGEREAAQEEAQTMMSKDGADSELLSMGEAAQVLDVTPSELARVVGAGGVRPAVVTGGGPLVRRGQLAAIRDALAGRKRAREDPAPFPGPGLVRQNREGEQQ